MENLEFLSKYEKRKYFGLQVFQQKIEIFRGKQTLGVKNVVQSKPQFFIGKKSFSVENFQPALSKELG